MTVPALALVLLWASTGADVRAEPCGAGSTEIQALRDNLELVRTQVRAARNESGTEKQPAEDAVNKAIESLEQAVGHPIVPSPESGIVSTPRGTRHPHAQVFQQAFGGAQRAFAAARCALPDSGEALGRAMTVLDKALQFR
jgi:hypothetical protein